MKIEKAVSCLWGIGLSFLISFSGIACLITAFDMGVNIWHAAICCGVVSLVSSVCYTLPMSLVPLGAGAILSGYFWQSGELELSVEALLNRLSRQYNRAYGWGIIRWGLRTADAMEPTMILILCIFGALVAMAVSWAVCRRKTVIPGIFLGILPLAACFVVTDTVPDTVWLYSLLLGLVIVLISSQVRQQDERDGNRVCAMVTLSAALVLLVLFAAVPREGYAGQAGVRRFVDAIFNTDSMQLLLGKSHETDAVGAGGDSSAVDLKTVGYRMESETKIMEVSADFSGTVYLRGRALDAYDGLSWSDSGQTSGITLLRWPSSGLEEAGEVTLTTRYAHRMLYMPYYVTSRDLGEVTVGIENEKKLTQYSFSCKVAPDPEYFNRLYPSPRVLPLEWPDGQLNQFIKLNGRAKAWARPLVEQITGEILSPYHKAQVIADYVRNSAVYDTNTPRMPRNGEDFVKWFLEESDSGYCVHFASATAVLLQAAGIPARYVTGYTAQVKAGQTVQVTAKQAHAWVEYWLPGFGWMVLEATPAASEGGSEPSSAAVEDPTLPDTTDDMSAVPSSPASELPGIQGKPPANGVLLAALWVVATGLGLTAIAEGQRWLRRRLWQRRYDRGNTNEQAILLWQETVRLARLLGDTPDKQLFELAQRAKFSQHTLEHVELQQFDAYVSAARNRLRKKSVFHRFCYRIILAVY